MSTSFLRKYFKFFNDDFAERYIAEVEKHLKENRSKSFRYKRFQYKLISLFRELYYLLGNTTMLLKLSKLEKDAYKSSKNSPNFSKSELDSALKQLKKEKGLTDYIKSYVKHYF